MLMEIPETAADIERICVEAVRKNGFQEDVYIRPIIYKSEHSLGPKVKGVEARLCCWIIKLGDYVDVETGLDVCVSSWRRVADNAIPTRAKPTGAYLNSALARREAMDNGFDEAILLTEAGKVSEGSAEHVFIIRDGVLYVPPSTEDNLDGITRRTLITLARDDLGLAVHERSLGRSELYVADEMFLCGTGAQVTPVRSVDRRPLGEGSVGPITRRIATHFDDVVRGRVVERRSWLTPVWG
jgi:branched-chain amino acid aminotransferase